MTNSAPGFEHFPPPPTGARSGFDHLPPPPVEAQRAPQEPQGPMDRLRTMQAQLSEAYPRASKEMDVALETIPHLRTMYQNRAKFEGVEEVSDTIAQLKAARAEAPTFAGDFMIKHDADYAASDAADRIAREFGFFPNYSINVRSYSSNELFSVLMQPGGRDAIDKQKAREVFHREAYDALNESARKSATKYVAEQEKAAKRDYKQQLRAPRELIRDDEGNEAFPDELAAKIDEIAGTEFDENFDSQLGEVEAAFNKSVGSRIGRLGIKGKMETYESAKERDAAIERRLKHLVSILGRIQPSHQTNLEVRKVVKAAGFSTDTNFSAQRNLLRDIESQYRPRFERPRITAEVREVLLGGPVLANIIDMLSQINEANTRTSQQKTRGEQQSKQTASQHESRRDSLQERINQEMQDLMRDTDTQKGMSEKQARREMMRRYHPDTSTDPNAQAAIRYLTAL